jgi:hypothetical protein
VRKAYRRPKPITLLTQKAKEIKTPKTKTYGQYVVNTVVATLTPVFITTPASVAKVAVALGIKFAFLVN